MTNNLKVFYCLSCKKNFEAETHKRKRDVKCIFCGQREFVRYSSPRERLPLPTKFNLTKNQLTRTGLLFMRAKYFLKLEHNLVAAMKKYITCEQFKECLMLAEKETMRKNYKMYCSLVEKKMLKEKKWIKN